jgi:hypothetical protein
MMPQKPSTQCGAAHVPPIWTSETLYVFNTAGSDRHFRHHDAVPADLYTCEWLQTEA